MSTRFYVSHDDLQVMGFPSPEFQSREEAEVKRDAWNEELPGHYVVEIEEAAKAAKARKDVLDA